MTENYRQRFSWPGLTRVATFRESNEGTSFYGVYRVARWADVQLVAVIPQHPHPPNTCPPLPRGTVTADISPFEAPSADTWHPAEHMVIDLYPLLFRFAFGPYCEVRVILNAWAREIRARHERTRTVTRRSGRHADEYRQWAAATRALAEDEGIGFDEDYQGAMRTAADAVERAVAWPDAYVATSANDPCGRADLFLTIHLWAVDRFVDAVNAFWRTAVSIPFTSGPIPQPPVLHRSALLRIMLEPWPWPADDADAVTGQDQDPDAWKMRIKRLDEERIRRGQHDALMAEVLRSLQTKVHANT